MESGTSVAQSFPSWECRGMCLPSLTLAVSFLIHLGSADCPRHRLSASSIQGPFPAAASRQPHGSTGRAEEEPSALHSAPVCSTKTLELLSPWIGSWGKDGVSYQSLEWKKGFNRNIYACTSFQLYEEHHVLFIRGQTAVTERTCLKEDSQETAINKYLWRPLMLENGKCYFH